MRGHFGDARCVFRRHPFPDQRVHGAQILGQQAGQLLMWFGCRSDIHHFCEARLDIPVNLFLEIQL